MHTGPEMAGEIASAGRGPETAVLRPGAETEGDEAARGWETASINVAYTTEGCARYTKYTRTKQRPPASPGAAVPLGFDKKILFL